MPHIKLETTADLPENSDVPDILEALVAKLSEFESIDAARVKARHVLCSNWTMGAGGPAGFAHCEVSVVSGRPAELRSQIADGMVEVMRQWFAASLAADEVAVTLEVREMDAPAYRK